MIPKEKAKQLVNRFDESLNHLACGTNGIERHIRERAVACALITVDEIINEYKKDGNVIELVEFYIFYWNIVKREIEKL